MSFESDFAQRAFAAFGAVAMSVTLMVSYFATPQVQSVAGILA